MGSLVELPERDRLVPLGPPVGDSDAGPRLPIPRDDQSGYQGKTLTFSSAFTDPGASDLYSIMWDFGNGNTAEGSLTAMGSILNFGTDRHAAKPLTLSARLTLADVLFTGVGVPIV